MRSLLGRLRTALAPQYEVEREIGSGGMGSVFLARDPKLDRRVAIKVLRPDLISPTAPSRFLREARILARLRHPNIVQIHHAGEVSDLTYYVMDYIEGETLAQRLRRGPLTREETFRLAGDLLSALEAAHDEEVIHRDVKPSNIFLLDDNAVLGDFGIAKKVEESGERLTDADHRVGTPGYMAPEQFMGDEVTTATDIYAAGMVLYEALTGRRWSIFTPTDEGDWSGVPADLVPSLRRALAWLPSERWVDVATFGRELMGVHTPSIVRPKEQSLFRVLIAAAWRTRRHPILRVIRFGLGYSLVAFFLIELGNALVQTGIISEFVYDLARVVIVGGLPLSLFPVYRRALRSTEVPPSRSRLPAGR
jgi:serine/threonine protein kinase